MLCKNCNKNEATMHMKRIINGRAAEVHLCYDCARSLGYGEAFSSTGFTLGELFRDLLLKNDNISVSSLRCSFCGKSFEDIATDGKMGCGECYGVFYDKLLPTIQRIHGKGVHMGKTPNGKKGYSEELENLKNLLQNAVNEQDFENAAKIRDKINDMLGKGEN